MTRPNKTDAGNGSYGICRVSNASRSPSPDPKRSATFHVMPANSAYLAAELREWPSKDHMASILRSAGLRVSVGTYSIRLDDFSHFVFTEYGGDLTEPSIDADADSAEALALEAQRVSAALGQAGVVHRFEIYSEDGEFRHYFHHAWPQTQ